MADLRRSVAEEGALFWLTVGAFVALGAVGTTGLHALPGITLAGAELLVAGLCWARRRIAFAVAVILGLALAVAALPILFGGEETLSGALVDALVILSGLLAAFFALRALRETSA